MGQVIVLSLTASLNPTLVAATTVMLLLDKPARLITSYLLGAYTTSITLGLLIGFSLSNANLVVLWLLVCALASFVVAPNWTPRANRSSQGMAS